MALAYPHLMLMVEHVDFSRIDCQEGVDSFLWPPILVPLRIVPQIVIKCHDASDLKKAERENRIIEVAPEF